jgi:hypothetical protein
LKQTTILIRERRKHVPEVFMLWDFLTREQEQRLWNALVDRWICWGEKTNEEYLRDFATQKGKHDIKYERLRGKPKRRKLED